MIERVSEQHYRSFLAQRPQRAGQLYDYVTGALELVVPRRAFCEKHDAPFAYLNDAFFDAFTDAVVWANRGGGKTMLGAVVTLLDALFKPGISVRILGGSLEQSRKMYRYLRRLLVPQFRDKLRTRGRLDGIGARTLAFRNESEVEILAQSERSVRGNRVQKMRCDEVELFDGEVWTSCQLVTESRTVDHPPRLVSGAVEAFSTMHRPHGLMQQLVEQADARPSPVYRWCVLDVMERCGPDRACDGCALWAECGGALKDKADDQVGFYRIDDAIAAKRRVSKETWESEMLCLRPSREGAVFPAFDAARHIRPVCYDAGRPLFRAIDFGFVNPFVCLWVQTDAERNVYVLGEYLRTQATLSANIARVRKLDPGRVKLTYCDPAGGQRDQMTGTTPRAELHAAGLPTVARPSQITDGLELIRRWLDGGPGGDHPGLRIDPLCERLIRAFESYRYPDANERRRGANAELPLKDGVHDHPIDALRYFFINHLGARRGRVTERLY